MAIKPSQPLTATSGSGFELRCPIAGYPVDQVYITKDGKKLPLNDGQVVTAKGSIWFNSIAKSDSGLFKCVAMSTSGQRAEGFMTLNVLAPPKVSLSAFPDNLDEGMRTSVMCSVMSGDPPLTVTWLKDGQLIAATGQESQLRVIPISEFVSSLVINSLSSTHSGNYTCHALSPAGQSNVTAILNVRSAPVFILKPMTMSTVTGSNVRLDCIANGSPQPVTRWKVKKATNGPPNGQDGGKQNGGQPAVVTRAILSTPRIHMLENGSLVIKAISADDAGHYYCESSNGIGERPIETIAELFIFEAPRVATMSSLVTAKKGEPFELVCSVHGSPRMTVPLDQRWRQPE
ncbi:Down syndrome cell adhesion molecule-like protein Dscam2 [Halotydeus destructor]|nr:Down syndrome cell adhesion molecule-like protein Dscam2 [Halotydeus destructor]